MKNKIAYLSPTFMSDVDLSYLSTLHNQYPQLQVDYFLMLSPTTLRGAAINISQQKGESGVVNASIYDELRPLGAIFPLEHFFVVNDRGSGLTSLSSYQCYWQLYRRLRHYDIIHFTWPLPLVSSILYLLRSRMVMTVHDPFPHSSVKGRAIKLMRWLAFRCVSRFILLNEAQHEEFVNYYKLHNAHVYTSRLSAYTYLIPQASGKAPEGDYILFFGQVTPHKGIRYLFQAMEQLHKQHPQLQLLVAGRWKRGYSELEVDNPPTWLRLMPRYIPDNELADLIRGSRFVVTPYLDATQSGVIMSAFAFGKPCIATNVGGLPEMVEDDKYGIIVPPRDSQAIADAAETLIAHPEQLQTYSQNIIDDYINGSKSWKNIAHEMLDIYEKAI